jgi:arylsulfatase A-like enzyme
MKVRKLDTKTLLVIVGDHGQAFGFHPQNFMHAAYIFDENVRVPALLIHPLLFPGGGQSNIVGQQIDIMPTILDLLGIDYTQYAFQGQSLFKKRKGAMAFFFTEYNQILYGLRDGSFKFIFNLVTGTRRLYNLQADPGELNNIAKKHDKRCEYYIKMLRQFRRQQRFIIRNFAMVSEVSKGKQ